MKIELVRVLRTHSSERFVLRHTGTDVGAVDLHYLRDGTVQATMIIFEGSGLTESDIPGVLTTIDEVLLPEVSLDDRKLIFTVVVGRVLGAFEPTPEIATDQSR